MLALSALRGLRSTGAGVQPLCITAFTATCAAGAGRAELLRALDTGRIGSRVPTISAASRWPPGWDAWRASKTRRCPRSFAAYECRNNRLAWLGLRRDGFLESVSGPRGGVTASDRVALVLGTSTSSIGATEEAYIAPVAGRRISRGSAATRPCTRRIPPASSCSARWGSATWASRWPPPAPPAPRPSRRARGCWSWASPTRWSWAAWTSLCGSVLFGFNSLALVSPEPCRPFDAQRSRDQHRRGRGLCAARARRRKARGC